MGQASSVQREPSMEEILASIRRIIEDSDASRKGPAEPETPAGQAAGAEDIAAFRTGLHERSSPVAEDGSTASQFGAASGFPLLPEASPGRPFEPALENGTVSGFSYSASSLHRPPAVADRSEHEIDMELDMEGFDEPVAADEERAVAKHGEPLGELRPSILSEGTGRKVAASFGDLSDALAARSRKGFDQMAEEMLRPMLQDWLDNNLPHLVEKLVREEIERIARGSAPR